MAEHDCDLFVVGGGSAGVRAARVAARHGAKVVLAESQKLGGTCVNVGCVPKKLLVYASQFSEAFSDARGFGWTVTPGAHSFADLVAAKNSEIERLNAVYERLLRASGVEIVLGRARFVDPHTLTVGERAFRPAHVLIATGGAPEIPDVPGREHVISSNEAFFLGSLPERAIVVGGGYIAVEFAGIFHGLGAQVTLLHRGPMFLRGFERDAAEFLAEEMTKRGIDLRFDARVRAISRSGEGLVVDLEHGDSLEAGLVLYATGRRPTVRDLGLDVAGVELDARGAVKIDEAYRTTAPHVYAVGDVTDRINLTPVAIAEGQHVADALFGPSARAIDYTFVPSCVFSQPNLGTVGLTEAQARERYGAVDVYKTSFKPLKHQLSGRNERTFMKLLVDRKSDRVVGLHVVAPDAGEIVQGFAVAMNAGATKADFDRTIGIHPTAAEELVTLRTPEPEPSTD